jgi:hypothetical protein
MTGAAPGGDTGAALVLALADPGAGPEVVAARAPRWDGLRSTPVLSPDQAGELGRVGLCGDATERVHSGDRVRVDGGAGTVEILERA